MLGKALKVAAIGLCAVLPLSAHANNFNYNMMEFRMGTSLVLLVASSLRTLQKTPTLLRALTVNSVVTGMLLVVLVSMALLVNLLIFTVRCWYITSKNTAAIKLAMSGAQRSTSVLAFGLCKI